MSSVAFILLCSASIAVRVQVNSVDPDKTVPGSKQFVEVAP